MLSRRLALYAAAIIGAALFTPLPVLAAPPVKAIASFSILGDMVREVGGERVVVTTLVGPDGDAHVYQPAPADAQAVGDARIIVVNGLGYEGWIDRLIASAGFRGQVIVASAGITPLAASDEDDHANARGGHDHGGIDPHAWQSLKNGEAYVRNIAAGLAAVDPGGAATYRANAERYVAQLAALDREVRDAIAKLPPNRRTVVTSHDAFAYFGAAYGIHFLSPAGVSTEADASARDVARLIRQIRAEKVPAVFMENISDPRLVEQIRRETGAAIGGTLFSDALSAPGGPAPTYLEMFRHNVKALTSALSS